MIDTAVAPFNVTVLPVDVNDIGPPFAVMLMDADVPFKVTSPLVVAANDILLAVCINVCAAAEESTTSPLVNAETDIPVPAYIFTYADTELTTVEPEPADVITTPCVPLIDAY